MKRLLGQFINLSSNKNKSFFLNALYISFITLYLIYNFFVIGKYSSYPWWHDHGNDADAPYAATAISLINNCSLSWAQHPAATFSSINAFILRALGLILPTYKTLLNISSISSIYQFYDLIEKGVQLGRLQALFTAIIFTILFFNLIRKIVGSSFITFLLTFYLMTSNALIIYSYWIRPELLSLICIFGILYLILNTVSSHNLSFNKIILTFAAVGLLSGFALLTKIQMLSAVALMVFYFVLFIMCSPGKYTIDFDKKKPILFSLFLALINIIICPWWCFKRPASFPEGFIGSMNGIDNYNLFNKLTPPNFYFLPLTSLIVLFLFTLSIFILTRSHKSNNVVISINKIILFLNCLITGIWLSIYLVFIPTFTSFEKYIANTNVVVYTMLTNIFKNTFLHDGSPVTVTKIFHKISTLHHYFSQLMFINIFYIVIAVALISLIKVVISWRKNNILYLLTLATFSIGIIMDTSACFYLRDQNIYIYYAVYSLTFFTIGFAIFLRAQLEELTASKLNKALSLTLILFFIFTLTASTIITTVKIVNAPKANKITTQSPFQVFDWLIYYNRSLWAKVLNSIENTQTLSLFNGKNPVLKASNNKEMALEDIRGGLHYLSLANSDIMNIKSALFYFKKAMNDNAREPSGYLLSGNTYMRVGAYEQAINIFNAALIEFPNNGIFHYQLATCYEKNGNLKLAIANAKTAILIFQEEKKPSNLTAAQILLSQLINKI
jgi:tetratricopeptide (TPR) repeat protein